jgi:hypothetical protein
MRKMLFVLLSLSLGFWISGCSRDTLTKLGTKDDACYPGKPGQHIVELAKVKVQDQDFSKTPAGDPLPVRVYFIENDYEVDAEGGGVLSGTRGERTLDPPLRWMVNFKPDAKYQIVVEEQGEGGTSYAFPPTPRPGFWPVPANNYTFRIGRNSFIRFTEEVRTEE